MPESFACDEAGPAPDTLGWALGTVGRAFHEAALQALADFAPGPRGFQVLNVVGTETPRSQAALAAYLGIDRTAMTYLIDDLEGANLIQRAPSPHDRRARILTLTPAGVSTLGSLQAKLVDAEETLLSHLGQEAETFRTLIKSLANGFADANGTASLCEP